MQKYVGAAAPTAPILTRTQQVKQHHVLASLDPHHIQTGRVNNLCSIYQASLPSPQKCRDRVIKVVLLLHINTFGIDVPHQGLNPKATVALIL